LEQPVGFGDGIGFDHFPRRVVPLVGTNSYVDSILLLDLKIPSVSILSLINEKTNLVKSFRLD